MQLGFLGLGKMGKRMVIKLVLDGHDVVIWNRSHEVSDELISSKTLFTDTDNASRGTLTSVGTIDEFQQKLQSPRVLWLMLPAGEVTASVLLEVKKFAQKGDVVIDGGNSFYLDTQKRSEEFEKLGIHFLGIGVSGGILAPVNGFPFMVGGSRKGYHHIVPILDTLSYSHGGHVYFGKGGVGHFIKMIHNGIEYGMMQSLGEGFGVLEKGPYAVDLLKIAKLWQKGTIISSFLLDRAKDALQKDKKLEEIVGFIEENKEALWTIQLAKKLHVPIQVIEDSLNFRQQSQKSKITQQTFAAKMVAALRHEFGGHRVMRKNSIKNI